MSVGDKFVLKKSSLTMFFASIAYEMQLVAPKKLFAGDAAFDVIESPKDIAWDYGHDIYPPKRFLLPHHEDMFRYRAGKNVDIEDLGDAPKQAIVGIRSCDAKAIRQQERFFTAQITDPYYKARIDNTVLFSLACNKPPRAECFCVCCDAGPYLESGYDVQLTDLGDKMLYEVGSEKGDQATQAGAYMLEPVEPADVAELRRIQLKADSLFESTTAYMAKAVMFISDDAVPQQVWEELGSTCFRCAACTNLCPVCTCYTVDDLAGDDGRFTRCRSWDSCQYAGFAREASGHNPRATFGSRVQRRFYHKASYPYIMRDGAHGCVGCGRCVSACLTKLDLPSVVKRIRRSMHDYLEAAEV